jgi:hypothetical protein
MNKIYFEIIFKLRYFPLFLSAYRYIRHCTSYALNFLRSSVKASNIFILEYVSFYRTVGIIAVIMVLPVGLNARSLFLPVDIITHSVIYTR